MVFGGGHGRRRSARRRLGALRRHFSYANVAASLALFMALGGTSYAAIRISSRNIRNGAVTRDKIAGNAVTSTKVRNGTLLSKDFKAGQLPSGPPGAPGATGATGPAGPAGTARAYGSVQPGTNGVLNPKNVARVYTPSAGIYCVTLPAEIPATSAVVTATVNRSLTTSASPVPLVYWFSNPTGGCSGNDIQLATINGATGALDAGVGFSFIVG